MYKRNCLQLRLLKAQNRARQSTALLAHRSAQLEAILEGLQEGISLFSAQGQLEFCNQRLLELLQQPTPEQAIQALQTLAPELRTYGDKVVLCKQPQGQVLEARTITVHDGGVLCVVADITQRQQHQEHTEYLANHDALTGLLNRRQFEAYLGSEIALAHRLRDRFAVLYFDLDRFKPINDTYGHAMGDLVLVHVAQVLRETVRECDYSARVGGDEFAVLLRGVEHSVQVLTLAQRLGAVLSEPWQEGSVHLHIGASIGLAMYPEHGQTPQALLVAADRAMYLAKSNSHASGSLAPRW